MRQEENSQRFQAADCFDAPLLSLKSPCVRTRERHLEVKDEIQVTANREMRTSVVQLQRIRFHQQPE